MKSLSRDVAVIGGGLAGLVCARRLLQGGASVALIEASERTGGRTHGTQRNGACFDLGGQWIGPGQHRVQALADELGLATFPISVDGELRTYRGTIPRLSPGPLLELGRAVARTYAAS